MWPRIVECMLGVWLLMSPFIFDHPPEATGLWINDLAVGTLLTILSLASYYHPTRWAHWLLILVALWLLGFGRLTSTPPLLPGLQNDLIVGLLLGMFALIPNQASRPPAGWRTVDIDESQD